MHLDWLLVFVGTFLLLVGIGIGSGLYNGHRKFWNDVRAREIRERNERTRRQLL